MDFKYTTLYQDLTQVKGIDLGSMTVTWTEPCNGVVYLNKDGTFSFVSDKQYAINEIKEQPFFK